MGQAKRVRSAHPVALLLIDVINDFDFASAAGMVRHARKTVDCIARLATRARTSNVPVIYVNDNFGQWRSDFNATIKACTTTGRPGSDIAFRLKPKPDDYFVLKPRHSGFYCTTLELLLEHLGTRTLILTGYATHSCVLFTANDAHMRGFNLAIPTDCTASSSRASKQTALLHMRHSLGARTAASRTLSFAALGRLHKKPRGQTF